MPTLSLSAVFKRTGIDPREVDLVAVCGIIRNTVFTRDYKPVFTVLPTQSDWHSPAAHRPSST